MCGCGDLKYARRNHSHKSYVTQAAVDAAIAASGHVDQAAVDAAIAASGHVDQAAVDAAIAASGHVDQAAYDATIDYLQTQIDALLSQIGVLQLQIDTNMTYTQGELDAINQALIDCGCVSSPCQGWADEFDDNVVTGMTVTGDWVISESYDVVRIERYNGATDASSTLNISTNVTYRPGMTLEIEANQYAVANISSIYLTLESGATSHGLPQVATNGTPLSVDLSTYLSDGDPIDEIKVEAVAIDGPGTTYANLSLRYVRLVCP